MEVALFQILFGESLGLSPFPTTGKKKNSWQHTFFGLYRQCMISCPTVLSWTDVEVLSPPPTLFFHPRIASCIYCKSSWVLLLISLERSQLTGCVWHQNREMDCIEISKCSLLFCWFKDGRSDFSSVVGEGLQWMHSLCEYDSENRDTNGTQWEELVHPSWSSTARVEDSRSEDALHITDLERLLTEEHYFVGLFSPKDRRRESCWYYCVLSTYKQFLWDCGAGRKFSYFI